MVMAPTTAGVEIGKTFFYRIRAKDNLPTSGSDSSSLILTISNADFFLFLFFFLKAGSKSEFSSSLYKIKWFELLHEFHICKLYYTFLTSTIESINVIVNFLFTQFHYSRECSRIPIFETPVSVREITGCRIWNTVELSNSNLNFYHARSFAQCISPLLVIGKGSFCYAH